MGVMPSPTCSGHGNACVPPGFRCKSVLHTCDGPEAVCSVPLKLATNTAMHYDTRTHTHILIITIIVIITFIIIHRGSSIPNPVKLFLIESLRRAQIKKSQSDAVNVISLSLYEAPAKVPLGRLFILRTWAWVLFSLPFCRSFSLTHAHS